MINLKRIILTSSAISAIIAGLVIAGTATAATAPEEELQSMTYSNQCMDVYHDNAAVDTVVRTFPCDANRTAEQFALNGVNGHEYIFFRPTLCIGNSDKSTATQAQPIRLMYSAVLKSCGTSTTKEKEILISKGVVAFKYTHGILTAQKPVPGDLYPQLQLKPGNGSSAGQAWKIVTVN